MNKNKLIMIIIIAILLILGVVLASILFLNPKKADLQNTNSSQINSSVNSSAKFSSVASSNSNASLLRSSSTTSINSSTSNSIKETTVSNYSLAKSIASSISEEEEIVEILNIFKIESGENVKLLYFKTTEGGDSSMYISDLEFKNSKEIVVLTAAQNFALNQAFINTKKQIVVPVITNFATDNINNYIFDYKAYLDGEKIYFELEK